MARKHISLRRTAFVLFLLFTSVVGVANADITSDLAAHWTFDDGGGNTALDSSGNGLDGTLQGDPQWVAGRLQGALQFDGVDDFVRAPHIPLDSQTFTIAMWVNPVLYTTQQTMFSQRQASATNTDMHFRFGGPSGTAPSPGAVRMGFYSNDLDTPGGIIQDNNWYHITFWYDSENQDRRIYINGVQEAQAASTPYLGTSGDTVIGSWAGGGEWLRGIVDEVRIYHRALTPDDITELYNWIGGANAGDDQRVQAGTEVTLSGAGPGDATSFTWEQVLVGDEPVVTLADPSSATTTFTPPVPASQIGYVLTFQLTVEAESTGTTTDEVLVEVTSPNTPRVVPGNFRALVAHRALLLTWSPVLDADEYVVSLEVAPGFWFDLATTPATEYLLQNLDVGVAVVVKIKTRNSFGVGAETDPLTLMPMRNLALPAANGGMTPPTGNVYVISQYAIAGMNDGVYDVSNDSWDGNPKSEDYWGYLWADPILIDHVVYFTGGMFQDGGWFRDLTVQYTQDGTTWIDVPSTIVPPYSFVDDRQGREEFERYDIVIPVLRGTGLRIYGTPGGTATFTSIAELEVFGDHVTPRSLVVQGIDLEVPERGTVNLDGSFSFSTRGDLTSGTWEQVSGTPVTLEPTGDPLIATFTAPALDADEELVFKLTASDGTETLSDDDVRITVRNLVTTAVAGPDRKVEEGTDVTLDGLGSLSTTGDLTYLWAQTTGTPVGVTGSTDAVVNFTAPILWANTEALTFQLEVNDGAGGVSTDEVVITVHNPLMVSVPFEDFEDGVADGFTVVAGTWDIVDGWYVQSDTTAGLIARSWVNIGAVDEYAFEVDCVQMGGETKVIFAQPDVGENYRLDLWPNRARVIMGATTDDMQNLTLYTAGQVFHVKVELTPEGVKTYVNGQALHDTPWTGSATPDGKVGLGTYDNSSRFDNLIVSIPPSQMALAYAVRSLPDSYQAGGPLTIDLSVRADSDNLSGNVSITEAIPAGTTVADAGGGQIIGGNISWTLTDVSVSALSYTLNVTAGTAGAMNFAGNVNYTGVPTQDIYGDSAVYETPSAPTNLSVEMLIGGHLSWSASSQEGIIGYRVYRSVNGQPFEEIGYVTGISYVDTPTAPGSTYNYKVSAVNVRGVEGPLSAATGEKMVVMEIREAENYNYGGGQYPGYTLCPAAVEATATDDLAAGNDFFFATDIPVGDARRDYRPNDNCGIETVLDDGTTDVWHTNIGWITVADWWRYTFDVPVAGWIKLSFRVAAPSNATIAAYWDEQLVGTVNFVTGSWHTLTDAVLENQIQTTAGAHTLRVECAAGGFNLDQVGLGTGWDPPKRGVIWSDDFEDYTNLYGYADLTAAGYTVVNGGGDSNGAWRLWNTAGDDLGNEPASITAMTDNYVITDSDMAPDVQANEELITPAINCTDYVKVRLDFNKNYRAYLDDTANTQIAEVDIRSSDDGVTWGGWVNLYHYDRTTVDQAADPAEDVGPEQMVISQYADGRFIQVRFHFYQAQYDYWFAVDDIVVTGELAELPPPPPAVIGPDGSLSWDPFGGGNYTVQYTDDLPGGLWNSVPGTAWPITATTWPGEDISGLPKRYYRVVSE